MMPVTMEYKDIVKNEKFKLHRLSITEDTYVASAGYGTFVVKLRDNKYTVRDSE